jgi:hypothetical protein
VSAFAELTDKFQSACPGIYGTPCMTSFLEYFRLNWLVESRLLDWNVSAIRNHLRTNNQLEGKNNALRLRIGDKCQNIFTFFKRLSEYQVIS